jgi:hypothetical protein
MDDKQGILLDGDGRVKPQMMLLQETPPEQFSGDIALVAFFRSIEHGNQGLFPADNLSFPVRKRHPSLPLGRIDEIQRGMLTKTTITEDGTPIDKGGIRRASRFWEQ